MNGVNYFLFQTIALIRLEEVCLKTLDLVYLDEDQPYEESNQLPSKDDESYGCYIPSSPRNLSSTIFIIKNVIYK